MVAYNGYWMHDHLFFLCEPFAACDFESIWRGSFIHFPQKYSEEGPIILNANWIWKTFTAVPAISLSFFFSLSLYCLGYNTHYCVCWKMWFLCWAACIHTCRRHSARQHMTGWMQWCKHTWAKWCNISLEEFFFLILCCFLILYALKNKSVNTQLVKN